MLGRGEVFHRGSFSERWFNTAMNQQPNSNPAHQRAFTVSNSLSLDTVSGVRSAVSVALQREERAQTSWDKITVPPGWACCTKSAAKARFGKWLRQIMKQAKKAWRRFAHSQRPQILYWFVPCPETPQAKQSRLRRMRRWHQTGVRTWVIFVPERYLSWALTLAEKVVKETASPCETYDEFQARLSAALAKELAETGPQGVKSAEPMKRGPR